MSSGRRVVQCLWEGHEAEDPLTDNAYEDDGYRFHDMFHFGFAAMLGWSPIARRSMGRKRKTRPVIDEVEDGRRAKVVDECISALVYDYARNHNFLAGVTVVSFG